MYFKIGKDNLFYVPEGSMVKYLNTEDNNSKWVNLGIIDYNIFLNQTNKTDNIDSLKFDIRKGIMMLKEKNIIITHIDFDLKETILYSEYLNNFEYRIKQIKRNGHIIYNN